LVKKGKSETGMKVPMGKQGTEKKTANSSGKTTGTSPGLKAKRKKLPVDVEERKNME